MASNKPTQTDDRFDTLAKCEQIIEQTKEQAVDFYLALDTIRQNRWYKETHSTFDAYVADRLGKTSGRARQLIAWAKTATQVSDSQEDSEKPLQSVALFPSDAQSRELRKLPEKKRTPAWNAAVKAAGGEQPSMEHVRAAVAKRMPKQEKGGGRDQFDAQYNAQPPADPPEEHEPAPESETDPEPDPVDPDSLEAAQATVDELISATKSLAAQYRAALQTEKNEVNAPWLGKLSYMETVGQLNGIVRTLKRNRPVGGTKAKPVTQHEQDKKEGMG